MKTKNLYLPTVVMATLLPAAAQAEFNLDVGVFSDYIDNGESASNNNAVLQAGMSWTHGSGFFTGAGFSNLGEGEGQEVIPAIGYGTALGELEIELAYEYAYMPEMNGETYEGEAILGLGFGPVEAEIAYMVNAHDSDAEGSMVYVLGSGFELTESAELAVSLGYDDPDSESGVGFMEIGPVFATEVGDISFTYAGRDESGSQDLFVAGWSMSF